MAETSFIAIVDDDEPLREALAGLIRSFGYRTGSYESAEAFLASGDAARADCVVTDIQMPGLSGIGLKIRLDENAHAVPVIMITARAEKALLDRARASGAICVLAKPFETEALVGCIEKALNH